MREEATGKTGFPSASRLKPERPRDELGRPLPWDAANRLHLPDFDSVGVDENHALGLRFARQQEWFGAHEAWETAWKRSKGTGDEELFKGLSQMGAGYVHLLRGNEHGAVTLLRRAARRIGSTPAGRRDIATGVLADRLLRDATAVEDGDLEPGPAATVEPLPL